MILSFLALGYNMLLGSAKVIITHILKPHSVNSAILASGQFCVLAGEVLRSFGGGGTLAFLVLSVFCIDSFLSMWAYLPLIFEVADF